MAHDRSVLRSSDAQSQLPYNTVFTRCDWWLPGTTARRQHGPTIVKPPRQLSSSHRDTQFVVELLGYYHHCLSILFL